MRDFLDQRRGYCAQFAGTCAAFARALGLPARVAVGFTWGEGGEDGTLVVKGKHYHAWPEVYVEGVGWVPFEPTPGRGIPGAEQYTGVAPAQAGGDALPPPAAQPATQPVPTTRADSPGDAVVEPVAGPATPPTTAAHRSTATVPVLERSILSNLPIAARLRWAVDPRPARRIERDR